jgi:hypothetical protein
MGMRILCRTENGRVSGLHCSYLAGEAGIRQFLDISTGLPTASNTHEVAQVVALECRIVYVDNDPLIMEHTGAVLTSTPEGILNMFLARCAIRTNFAGGRSNA